MRRSYLIAGLLLAAGLIVTVVTLLTNRITIPDAQAADLGIAGHLLLASPDAVTVLDLATGEPTVVFTAEPRAVVIAAAMSPDGETLALAYAPPPPGMIQFGYTNLVTVPLDGSGPITTLVDGMQRDAITDPRWTPDGTRIMYVRAGPSADGLTTDRSIESIAIDGGEPRTLVHGGFSPDVSPDGTLLAYVAPQNGMTDDRLLLARSDGGGASLIPGGDQFVTVDAPRFSSDGGWILFSGDQSAFAPTPAARHEPAIDWTLVLGGVRVASAHSTPTSDLWRIPVQGGNPSRLVRLLADGIRADTSPDGRHIAFVTVLGLYVANADGTGASRIDSARCTSVEWLPD